MELKREKVALLDKISIYNFTVTDIMDFKQLESKGYLVKKENSKYYIETQSGQQYSSINIEGEKRFDRFTYSISVNGGIYGCLEMSVPSDGYHNLNCLSPEEYRDLIYDVNVVLATEYGIIADFSEARYKQIEINKTICLDRPYGEYQRILSLMMYLLPAKLRLGAENSYSSVENPRTARATDYKKEIQTFIRSSGEMGLTIKIYDKSSQLEQQYQIHLMERYLRYEITLNSPKKINRTFGTCDIHKITSDMLQEYFTNFVKDCIEKPYEESCKKRYRAIYTILKDNYKYNDRKWIQRTFLLIANTELTNRGIPILLDVKEIFPLLDRLPFASRSSKSNTKARFKAEAKNYLDVLVQDDDLKYIELISKLK